MSSLILIDLSAIFWRYWHASESEEISSAKRKTIQLVESLIRDHDHCAICTDAPPYIRKEWYPDYKKGREHPPMAVEELKNTIKELKAIGIPYYGSKGYEADDVIYTLADQGIMAGLDVFIAATDKDLLQIPGAKITEPFDQKVLTPEEKFGCPAEMVKEVLALCGDTADNIPGVPGIGPKKALQVLDIIGNVSDLLDSDEQERGKFYVEMPEAMSKNISENIEQLRMSYKLVTLLTAPVELVLEAAKKQDEQVPENITIEDQKQPEETVETTAVSIQKKSEVAIKSDS
jgi:DNA polymerase-1